MIQYFLNCIHELKDGLYIIAFLAQTVDLILGFDNTEDLYSVGVLVLFVISVVAATQYSPEAPTGGQAVQR